MLLYPEDEYYKNDMRKADLILSILFNNFYLGSETKIINHILSKLEPNLSDPEFCARIVSVKYYIENTLQSLNHEIESVGKELENNLGKGFQKTTKLEEDQFKQVSGFISKLEIGVLSTYSYYIDGFNNLYKLAKIEERHLLFSTKYNLYLLPERKIRIAEPIEKIIIESAKNPSAIFKLTPRQFEEYIAKIFEGAGYEVQLTAKTKDGGADIICMTKKLDIPIKIAVEAKRYKPDNPISVGLVRSFIGVKDTLGANKLVFVTTSRFTRDAIKFATNPINVHYLELKYMPDIIKWANDYVNIKFPKLKNK